MKSITSIVIAALAFACVAAPASAFSTAHPTIQLIPLSATQVSVNQERPGCDTPAAIDGMPFFAVPAIAAEEGITGLAQVKLDLTSSGSVAGARLYHTSGNAWLDQAALQSARLTRFSAESAGCERVAGSYLYEVEF
jgi:TonB family protein